MVRTLSASPPQMLTVFWWLLGSVPDVGRADIAEVLFTVGQPSTGAIVHRATNRLGPILSEAPSLLPMPAARGVVSKVY